MSALSRIWIVRDPSPYSTLADICWEDDVCNIGDYAIGGGPGEWRRERTAFHLTRESAVADATTRLGGAR